MEKQQHFASDLTNKERQKTALVHVIPVFGEAGLFPG